MKNFGLVIVGDEILSGKRQDKHLPKVIELLGERGLRLSWVRYVGDELPTDWRGRPKRYDQPAKTPPRCYTPPLLPKPWAQIAPDVRVEVAVGAASFPTK